MTQSVLSVQAETGFLRDFLFNTIESFRCLFGTKKRSKPASRLGIMKKEREDFFLIKAVFDHA